MYDMGQDYPESITVKGNIEEFVRWSRQRTTTEMSSTGSPELVDSREQEILEQSAQRPLSVDTAKLVLQSVEVSVSPTSTNPSLQAVHRSFNPWIG